MQQQRFIRQFFVATLISGGTMLMAACDDSDALPIQADEVRYSDTLIQPTATVVTPAITKGDFEGPINGTTFTPSSDKIFGVSAFVGNEVPTNWTPNSRIHFSPVHSDAVGKYFFDERKYYPIDNKLYFYAFSPMVNCDTVAGTATEHPKIIYNITGREDIVWSKNDTGIAKAEDPSSQQHPDFQFKHLLQRVIFSVKRTDNVSPTLQLTEIRITGIRTKATLDLITGDLTFEDDPSRSSISINYPYTPTTEFVTIPYDLMFEPGMTEFNIVAVIDGVEYSATVDLNPTDNAYAGEAGYKHIVQLTINGSTLNVEKPQLTDWESFTTTGNI